MNFTPDRPVLSFLTTKRRSTTAAPYKYSRREDVVSTNVRNSRHFSRDARDKNLTLNLTFAVSSRRRRGGNIVQMGRVRALARKIMTYHKRRHRTSHTNRFTPRFAAANYRRKYKRTKRRARPRVLVPRSRVVEAVPLTFSTGSLSRILTVSRVTAEGGAAEEAPRRAHTALSIAINYKPPEIAGR